MVTAIPDASLKRVFGTTRFFDVPKGRAVEVRLELPKNINPASFNIQASPVEWSYAETGISEQTKEPFKYSGTINYSPANGHFQLTLPPLNGSQLFNAFASAYLLHIEWTDPSTPAYGTQAWTSSYEIGYLARDYMPYYAEIRPAFKDVCQDILNTWTLLHDNAYGNSRPNLEENLQVRFTYEDVAQAMEWELSIFQSGILHPTHYNLTTAPLPMPQYLGIIRLLGLTQLSYRTAIGYLETPEFEVSPQVTYAKRNSYYDKWMHEYERLHKLEDDLQKIYQQENLGLASGSLLVGGGYFQVGSGLLTNQMIDAIGNGTLQNMFFPVWFDIGGDTNQVANSGTAFGEV